MLEEKTLLLMDRKYFGSTNIFNKVPVLICTLMQHKIIDIKHVMTTPHVMYPK